MLNIVLFGPPGAGKGTQSTILIDKYNLVHLSTGDILRGEIAAGTTLGLEAKSLMDKGDLVPDSVVIGMIKSKLENNPSVNGFIFDGFPRTLDQARELDVLLAKSNKKISLTLSLDVSEKELLKRLILRGKNSGRVDDQNEAIIKNRIEVYKKQTLVLKEYYESKGQFFQVNGEGTINDITNSVFNVINNYLN